MGRPGSAGEPQRRILPVLPRALFRHHVQVDDAPENAVLHRQFDYSVRRHHLPDGLGVLSAIRLRREGNYSLTSSPSIGGCNL